MVAVTAEEILDESAVQFIKRHLALSVNGQCQ